LASRVETSGGTREPWVAINKDNIGSILEVHLHIKPTCPFKEEDLFSIVSKTNNIMKIKYEIQEERL
jgi:hypothetical protein